MKKKILSLLLVCILTSFTVLLTGCGEKQNQEQEQEQNVEEQTQETSVEEIYKKYITEKKYEKEITEWNSEVDEYAILDIDQDGTEELILKAKDLDFFYALICGYNKDSQEVIVIDNIYGYGGLKYNSDTKEIGYSEMRQIQEAMSFGFYKIEDKKLVLTRGVGYEYQEYFIAEGENRRNATSDEVYAEIEKAKAIEYQKVSDLTTNQEIPVSNATEESSQNQESKLKYGTYTGNSMFSKGITLILNEDKSVTYKDDKGNNATGKYNVKYIDLTENPTEPFSDWVVEFSDLPDSFDDDIVYRIMEDGTLLTNEQAGISFTYQESN